MALWVNLPGALAPLAWLLAMSMDYWLKGFAYHVELAPWTFAAAAGAGIVIAWGTVFAPRSCAGRPGPAWWSACWLAE